MYVVSSSPLKRTSLLLMFKTVPYVVNVLVVRLLARYCAGCRDCARCSCCNIDNTNYASGKSMSRSLNIATYDGDTSIIMLSTSSINCVVFDLSLSDIPVPVNVLTGSVGAISNVKRFCGPSNGNDMIMPLPALIELNVLSLLNILNVIFAVFVDDDTNDDELNRPPLGIVKKCHRFSQTSLQ